MDGFETDPIATGFVHEAGVCATSTSYTVASSLKGWDALLNRCDGSGSGTTSSDCVNFIGVIETSSTAAAPPGDHMYAKESDNMLSLINSSKLRAKSKSSRCAASQTGPRPRPGPPDVPAAVAVAKLPDLRDRSGVRMMVPSLKVFSYTSCARDGRAGCGLKDLDCPGTTGDAPAIACDET
jgi:hypothetical protein